MSADHPKTTEAQDEAFSAGACAAYDDLGITEPPWHLGLQGAEVEAWKRGLASGYADVERLIKRNARD